MGTDQGVLFVLRYLGGNEDSIGEIFIRIRDVILPLLNARIGRLDEATPLGRGRGCGRRRLVTVILSNPNLQAQFSFGHSELDELLASHR
jgi:hypothetical protein